MTKIKVIPSVVAPAFAIDNLTVVIAVSESHNLLAIAAGLAMLAAKCNQ